MCLPEKGKRAGKTDEPADKKDKIVECVCRRNEKREKMPEVAD